MKFKHLVLALSLGTFLPLLNSQAADVTGLTVTGDYDHLNILWTPLSSTDFNDADGYAVQFSDRQSNVKITKPVTMYQNNNQDDVSLRRNSFDNDVFYYVRIYTYKVNGDNKKVLGNGSDMLKFKINYNNTVTADTISISDPVVSSTGTTQDISDFEFGALRKYPYDTFSDFFWSQPSEMASSDFDGFMLRVSVNNDMKDPIIEATVDGQTNSLRVTGLNASTNYYAQGSFYKNQGSEKVTFGDSAVRPFKTIVAIPRDSSSRQSRNIIKVEKRSIRKIEIGASSVSSSTTTSTTSSSSSSSSNTNSSTSVSSSSAATINSASQTEIRNKISDLKAQISKLQSELRRWSAKDTSKKTTSTRSSTTRKKSTSGLSIRERLKLRREAKRNQ